MDWKKRKSFRTIKRSDARVESSHEKMESESLRSSSLQQHTLRVEEVAGNVDLLTEILLRTPAISLLKFKCVSKQWYSIILDPKFVTDHNKLNASPPTSALYLSYMWLGIDQRATPVRFRYPGPLPSLFNFPSSLGHSAKFVDSSHGLFLCRVLAKNKTHGVCHVVCNPTMQKYNVLPDVPETYMGSNLAYYPCKALYKVIFSYQLRCFDWIFHIFSSDTASCKIVTAPLAMPTSNWYHLSEVVYWDGAIHWMCGKKETYHCRFDLTEEKSEVVQVLLGPKILCPNKIRYFGESAGRLFLIQTRLTTDDAFRILEMRKGCTGWIVKFKFNLRSAFPEAEYRLMMRNCSVVSIMVGDNENDAEIVVAGNWKVVSYNFESKTVKVLSSLLSKDSNPKGIGKIFGFQFQGSLAAV